MSRKRTIVTNTLSNIGTQFVSAGLPFVLLPFMLRYWGSETYGVLILAFSVQAFVQFLNGAISLTLMKYVAEFHAQRDFTRLNTAINSLWVITFVNNAVVSLALIVIGIFGLGWLNVQADMLPTARSVFTVMGCWGIVAGAFNFVDGVMYGMQRIMQSNLFRVVESLLMAATAVAVVAYRQNLVVYVFCVCLFPVLVRMGQFVYLKRVLPEFRFNVTRYFDGRELMALAKFSGFQIANQVADLLMFNSQKLIVQKLLGATSLTTFEIANKPNLMFLQFISFPLSAILPACSAAYARGDTEFLQKMLTMGTRLYLVLVLPVMFAFMLLMPQFVGLWLGSNFSGAVPAAQLFMLALMIACPFKVFSHMMIGKGRVFVYGASALGFAVVSVPISIFLVSQFGIIGGVGATLMFSLLVDVPANVYVMRKEAISAWQFLRSVVPVLAVLVVEYGLVDVILRQGWHLSWLQFAMNVALGAGIPMLACLFLVLRREERAMVGLKF